MRKGLIAALALAAWDEAWERGPAEPESLRLKMDRQRQLLERQASDAERAESRPEPSPR